MGRRIIKQAVRAAAALFAAPLVLLGGVPALAAGQYESYTYDYWMEPVPSPAYYEPETLPGGAELHLAAPVDLAASGDFVFVLDTGGNQGPARILVLDADLRTVRSIETFDNSGRADAFREPQGLFAAENGVLYVADTGNGRIVKMTADGTLLGVYGRPQTKMIDAKTEYRPRKIAVDPAGRMFIVAESVNQGLIELAEDGRFLRFVGANAVIPNMAQYIWRFFSSKEQLAGMQLFLPTEFVNVAIDEMGFVYAVSGTFDRKSASSAVIKRLNPKGKDVLRRTGYIAPFGDWYYDGIYSVLVDVAVHENGVYAAADSVTGRLFVYDQDGNLMSAFGGKGQTAGNVQVPAAVDFFGDRLLLLDSYLCTVQSYRLTEYGRAAQAATIAANTGEYAEAERAWREVLTYNANSDLAYIGLGKAALRGGRSEEAVACFKLAEHRKLYSKAYQRYRREKIGEYFPYVAVTLIVLSFLLTARGFIRKIIRVYKRLCVGYAGKNS